MTSNQLIMCTHNILVEPFFNNIETLGRFHDEPEIGIIGNFDYSTKKGKEKSSEKDRVDLNRKRCYKMTSLKKQASLYREDINRYLEKGHRLSKKQYELLLDLRRVLAECGHNALFREHVSNKATEFIGAHTCKHKICPICNAQRCKKTRRKFRAFFNKNPYLLQQYDFMHLTLTVPHSAKGGRFQGFYAADLMKLFNQMRKRAFWKRLVYAGEFSVEVTKNDSGLHIHIHSLLLVKKKTQNRNTLHKNILKHWNLLTSGASIRTQLKEEDKAAILTGNKLLTSSDVDQLDPSGATLIGLESLYISSKVNKPGYKYCANSGLWKKYLLPKDGDIFMAGIMECLKYHFEPLALKKDGSLDVALVAEILPAIKGQPLYRKFGAFHSATKNAHPDAKMLNINYKPTPTEEAQEIQEILEETGQEIQNPETKEVAVRSDYRYFLIGLDKVYLDPNDNYRICISNHRKKRYLKDGLTRTTFHALRCMAEIGALQAQNRKKSTRIKSRRRKQTIIF